MNRWFWKNGGTEKSGLEKPLDSEKHKLLRKDWVMKWYGLLTSPFAPVCYIDEKWFYRTNRRRKIKILPLGKHEESGDDAYSHPKMLSRRFPIKSMFMGVVGRPVAHRQFDGKIFLERVSKTKYITMCTAHTNFSDDALVNAEIKNGEWRKLFPDLHLNVSDVKNLFHENYELENAVVDRLEFFYVTKIGNQGNTKDVRIEETDGNISTMKIRRHDESTLPSEFILLNDINVKVRYKIGDEVEEDASCDSGYMLSVMTRVGTAIRSSYHWIPITQKCYLVMDNAGGHGTNEAITSYSKTLLDDFNIEIIFQIPRSPYTNVLDLGVWMSLQAAVERQHYLKRCNSTALVNSVMKTWNEGHLNHSITKVFNRLKPVLCNILEANGGNDLVETKRGKKHAHIKLEDVILQMQKENEKIHKTTLTDVIAMGDEENQDEIIFEDF